MPDYLTTAPVVATRSLEEAREAVARVYLPHELVGPRETMDMRLNAVTEKRFTLGYLTYGAPAELTMPATLDCYHVNLCTVGETWASRDDGARAATTGRTSGTVLNPRRDNVVRWSESAEQLILKIDRSSLESHLADLIGRPVTEVVDFDFALDLSSSAGRTLLRAVELLAVELDEPDGIAGHPLARAQLESYVLTALLQAGRHQFSDALCSRDDTRRLGRLAPVVRYIEDNADTELTPELLARVACVSVRTLHAAFHQQLGESPMSYVRRIRLGKVRAELLTSDPQRVRVTDVAVRWGFHHQSRFAQQYRAQFDELPRVTLHR